MTDPSFDYSRDMGWFGRRRADDGERRASTSAPRSRERSDSRGGRSRSSSGGGSGSSRRLGPVHQDVSFVSPPLLRAPRRPRDVTTGGGSGRRPTTSPTRSDDVSVSPPTPIGPPPHAIPAEAHAVSNHEGVVASQPTADARATATAAGSQADNDTGTVAPGLASGSPEPENPDASAATQMLRGRESRARGASTVLVEPKLRWTPATIREAQATARRALDAGRHQQAAMPGVPRVASTKVVAATFGGSRPRHGSSHTGAADGTQRDLEEAALRRRVHLWASHALKSRAAAQFW
jgi:hypothetical protein